MVHGRPLLLTLLLASCGRLGFDPRAVDAGDDSALDVVDGSAADLTLELHLTFEGTLDEAKRRPVGCVGSCPAIASSGTGLVGTFDGSACLSIASAPELETQSFTVAVWFRATSTGVESMFGKPLNGVTSFNNSFELYKTAAGNVIFATPGFTSTEAGQFTDASWHHAAATYAGGQIATYLDGVAGAMASLSTSYAGDALLIGCDLDQNTVVAQFVGELDDVRYYSRVLSAVEIAALAQ